MRSHARLHATTIVLLFALATGLAACGGGGEPSAQAPAAAPGGLTAEQLEKGIGPISEVSLGAEIEAGLAAQGAEVFGMKCSACHKLDQRYVGPALGDVLERRSPEFVMNMVLNPAEMLEKHPEAKAMLAQFMTPMPNQNLTREEARAILEYLRQEHARVAQAR